MEVGRVIEKETARANAVGCLALVSKGVEKFDREWNKLVEVGLPPCWDPQTGAFS